MPAIFSLILLPLVILTVSCMTQHPLEAHTPPTEASLENSRGPAFSQESLQNEGNGDLKQRLRALEEDQEISKKYIFQLQNQVDSLEQQSITNKKNLEILRRGIRSGVFDDEIKAGALANEGEPTQLFAASDPQILLTQAILKAQGKHFEEVIALTKEFQDKFPNFNDEGHAFLLESEANMNLKDYESALKALRLFYLKYPKSPDLYWAKFLEAQIYEYLGEKEKSIALYGDVIAVSPKSEAAQKSREATFRLRH